MSFKSKCSLLFFLLLLFSSWQGHSQLPLSKYALIIGVKSYQYVPPLQNSLNDAVDMATSLRAKGFQVIELYDPKTKREMQDALRKYFNLLQATPNAAGMVFYSGHGMQVDGANYLIPTQANPIIKADLDDQCLNMDYVMSAIEQAGNALNIFILDACRNNPFRSFSRSSEKGLSMVNTPKGSYIVYATKPGSVASDGTDRNGLFTSKLLKHMDTEGLKLEEVFKRVAADVSVESGDSQRPWIASDYTGDFFFTAGENTTSTSPTYVPEPKSTKKEVAYAAFDYGYGPIDVPTTTIGKQEWTLKNLNVEHFANGDLIPEAKTDDAWKRAGENKQPAWCYFNNTQMNGKTYGKLYNWWAVNDPRGLAPKGWHIPSRDEWTEIINYAGGEKNGANDLKGPIGWAEGNNGINGSNFTGLPGGYRTPTGTFKFIGKYGAWWSTSENGPTNALTIGIQYNINNIFRPTESKGFGYAVRCIKNLY